VRPRQVELLPYHSTGAAKYLRLGMPYRLTETPQPATADMARFHDVLTRAGLPVTIGG